MTQSRALINFQDFFGMDSFEENLAKSILWMTNGLVKQVNRKYTKIGEFSFNFLILA